MKKNEVANKQPNAVDILNGQKRGFEEATQREDLIIPRVKLLQALSPEVAEGGLKAGLIINSLTKEILPTDFIPVFKFTNWIRFNPRDNSKPGYDATFGPGDIIWRSVDPLDPKVRSEGSFGVNGELPLAIKFLNFFAYFPGVTMPIIISFSKTSYKAGKQLLSLAQFTPGDMFSRKYKLSAKQTKNDIGTFYVLNVEPAGKPSDEEYSAAESLYNNFGSKVKDIQVHEEGDEAANAAEQAPF